MLWNLYYRFGVRWPKPSVRLESVANRLVDDRLLLLGEQRDEASLCADEAMYCTLEPTNGHEQRVLLHPWRYRNANRAESIRVQAVEARADPPRFGCKF